MAMAMALAMAIDRDAAKRTENAMETLRLSFRRYIVGLSNENLPKFARVTPELDTLETVNRLPVSQFTGVEYLFKGVDLMAVVRDLIHAMGLVFEAVAKSFYRPSNFAERSVHRRFRDAEFRPRWAQV